MKQIQEKFKRFTDMDLNSEIIEALSKGKITTIKNILTLPNFEKSNNYNSYLQTYLTEACRCGHLGLVEYLLTSPKIKENPVPNGLALISACENGHLNIVRFLLASPKLKKHANIHALNEAPLTQACSTGQTEIVKYLLSSKELKEHANINANNGYIIEMLFKESRKREDIMNFLIFNLNIKKTKQIEQFLERNPNEKIEGWFKIRDLTNNLEKDLSSDKIIKSKSNSKKPKI